MISWWQKRLVVRDLVRSCVLCAAGLAWLSACGARSSLLDGKPRSDGAGGDAGAGCEIDPERPTALKGRVRDFPSSHPDFEKFIGKDRGIVRSDLDAEGKPVYAGVKDNPTTSSKESFDQWYRDVPKINEGKDVSLPLAPVSGGVAIEDNAFFPIDGQLLGNEGRPHNFHFTLEAHTSFRYQGGEVFTFEGDDDLFVFINGRLALDLGGVHSTEEGSINVDDLGLDPAGLFPLDVFFAERHTDGSTFRLKLLGFNLCE